MSGEEVERKLREHGQIVELLLQRAEENATPYPVKDCRCGFCEVARTLRWDEHERPEHIATGATENTEKE